MSEENVEIARAAASTRSTVATSAMVRGALRSGRRVRRRPPASRSRGRAISGPRGSQRVDRGDLDDAWVAVSAEPAETI